MAAAFISLFSLVLIVSVLYVTSPSKDLQVSKPMKEEVQTPSSKENQQLANENSSIDSKAQALQEEIQQQQDITFITMLEQAFSNEQQQCEVTINEKNIRILIKGVKKDKEKAESIMKEAYNLTKHKYFIEVAFQEK